MNLRQIYNENVIRKEGDTALYQWARLFKVKSWEKIRMLAEKNEIIDECAYTIERLSIDYKIRMQYEARTDAIAKSLLDVLDVPTIAAKTGLTEEYIRKL